MVPGLRGAVRYAQWATFAELMQLLVEHRVGAHEAIVLAGQATGDRAIIRAAHRVAGRLQSGESLDASVREESVFPPMLRWIIGTAQQQGGLSTVLGHATEYYRRISQHRADWFRTCVPAMLILFLGGTITMAYALMLFVPMTELLNQLGVAV